MVNKLRMAMAVAAFGLFMPSAHADNTRAHITVSDLDAVMQEEILVKARASLAKQQAELDRYPGTSATPNTTAMHTPLPQVAWRRATANGWLAKFLFSTGVSTIASVGEVLPGGYIVDQIDAAGVSLRSGDEIVELSAHTQASPESGATVAPFVQ